jgi:DNA polymerase III epsilon subunit-like protein
MIDQLMVDCETLGTSADSVIMSIGAVKFDLDSDAIDDEGFYASVSIDSNLAEGRKLDESTLIWWMGQSKEAQAVFHEPKQALMEALDSFIEWIGSKRYHVWSNGASFDLPLLSHAMKQFDWQPPWKFWDERCVRTYKNLPGVPKSDKPVAHNAMYDAIAQAKHIQQIHRKLFMKAAA